MTLRNLLSTTSAALVLAAAPAVAQMYEGYDSSLGYEGFHQGLMESGHFTAMDVNADMTLDENEFATGMYADWDTDDDMGISEAEYDLGTNRWYGADYDASFTDYDTDGSGLVDQNEFGANWDSEYYGSWDADGNSELSDVEYSQGVYNTADLDSDTVISVEEEGWFEGWFDGDDIEAEIEQTGNVLN